MGGESDPDAVRVLGGGDGVLEGPGAAHHLARRPAPVLRRRACKGLVGVGREQRELNSMLSGTFPHVETRRSKQGMLGNTGTMLSYVQGGPSARGKAYVDITGQGHRINLQVNTTLILEST